MSKRFCQQNWQKCNNHETAAAPCCVVQLIPCLLLAFLSFSILNAFLSCNFDFFKSFCWSFLNCPLLVLLFTICHGKWQAKITRCRTRHQKSQAKIAKCSSCFEKRESYSNGKNNQTSTTVIGRSEQDPLISSQPAPSQRLIFTLQRCLCFGQHRQCMLRPAHFARDPFKKWNWNSRGEKGPRQENSQAKITQYCACHEFVFFFFTVYSFLVPFLLFSLFLFFTALFSNSFFSFLYCPLPFFSLLVISLLFLVFSIST